MGEPILGVVGVSGDEERVYRALLESPGLTATGLETQTWMSSLRTRRALDGLERKAMVARRGGSPVTFQPAPPDIVVDALIAQRQQEMRQARIDAAELMALVRPRPEQTKVADLVEILSTREAVTERWLQLQGATRHRLEVLVRPPYGQRRIDEDEAVQEALLDRGVVTRGVYDRDALEVADMHTHIRAMVSKGEQARVVSTVPVKLAIFDRRVALVPLIQPAPSSAIEAGLVVHESALLDALLSLFDSMWNRGSDVRFDEAASDQQADQGAVLTLLAAGLKDDAVARQLGVSTNTVRRRIAAVLAQLGVTTRFQAGLALSREGWTSGAVTATGAASSDGDAG